MDISVSNDGVVCVCACFCIIGLCLRLAMDGWTLRRLLRFELGVVAFKF